MRVNCSVLWAGLCLAAPTCALSSVRLIQVSPARAIVTDLVQVLNGGDEAKIRRFVQLNVLANAPIDKRVSRWKDLSNQGAPFKIVHDLLENDERVVVVMVDKNGSRIALTVHLETRPHVLIHGIQLAPAFTIEGLDPILRGWNGLSDLAHKIRVQSHSPGIGVAVYRNGFFQTAVDGVRSNKSSTPVKVTDVWRIGSIGKPLCSTLIARLIETGKLRWEETLAEALPGEAMELGYRKVTLEQLMRHRGGVPEDLSVSAEDVTRIVGTAKTPTAVRNHYAKNILSRPLLADPDKAFIYSNAGYALLAHVAERVTGKPYETLLQQWVFQPLGLKQSFAGTNHATVGAVRGHREGPNGLESFDLSGPAEWMFAASGGGISMSIGDIARFGQMHLHGMQGHDGYLKAVTIARLHEGVLEQLRSGRMYADGWSIDTLPGVQPFHGHNGSDGTTRMELAIFPKANLVVVGAVNRGGDREPSPGMQFVQALGERFAPAEQR